MNDWIMFGLLMFVILEIIFISLRINFSYNSDWVFHKLIAIMCTLFIGLFQLIIVTEYTAAGDPLIFRWGFLLYELYVIIAIVAIFVSNYFVSKLVDKFS